MFPYGPNRAPAASAHSAASICFDTYTPILGGTFAAALGGASAALHAAELVATGAERQVYVLTRPPGHHAERDRCGGYCYFNNAALAAERLAKLGKVAILDLDVHHGNGTQHIFYERARRAHGVDPRRPGESVPVLLGLRATRPARARDWAST